MPRPTACLNAGLLLALFAVTAGVPEAAAQKKTPPDEGKVAGKIWQYEILDGKEVVDRGRYRLHEFEIFGLPGRRVMGSYKYLGKKADQMELTFTGGKFKGYHAKLRLVTADPPVWEGDALKAEANKIRLRFTLLKD